MTFKNYLDACNQISAWCIEEAQRCADTSEAIMWLDSAKHWRERAVMAETAQTERGSMVVEPGPSS